MKPILQATLMLGLVLAPSVDRVAAAVRSDRPIDIELDRLGALSGEIHPVDRLPRDGSQVLVYRSRRLVARGPVTADGGFRIEGLDGGLYWVTAPGVGQAVRVWALGTAPPQSQRRLDLVPAARQPQPASTRTIVRGQAPYAYGPPTGFMAQPMPAYPFQPYQVPGGGMMFPGTYTSPGAVFFNPLLTAAVITGVAGVIVVVTDDDDPPSIGAASASLDGGTDGSSSALDVGPPSSP